MSETVPCIQNPGFPARKLMRYEDDMIGKGKYNKQQNLIFKPSALMQMSKQEIMDVLVKEDW
jgi:hypothetical protein